MFDVVDKSYQRLVDILVEHGIFRKVEFGPGFMQTTEMMPIEEAKRRWPDTNVEPERKVAFNPILAAPYTDSGPQSKDPYKDFAENYPYLAEVAKKEQNVKFGVDLYLKNGKAIEHNFEEISRTAFGFLEDKKNWSKELKTAVREHGHDEVLSGFYNWCETNSNFVGKKPVSMFLRNVGSNLGVKRPVGFTNQNLDQVVSAIDYESEHKVFFGGSYRAVLAGIISQFGPSLVIEAFREFYPTLTDKDLPYAPKNFLERAPTMIPNILRKQNEVKLNEARLQNAYKNAQSQVYQEPDEDLEEL